jgi:THO complex subunit 1
MYCDRETHKLSEEQTSWITEATDQVYRLLKDTPPDGVSFARSIRHILKV